MSELADRICRRFIDSCFKNCLRLRKSIRSYVLLVSGFYIVDWSRRTVRARARFRSLCEYMKNDGTKSHTTKRSKPIRIDHLHGCRYRCRSQSFFSNDVFFFFFFYIVITYHKLIEKQQKTKTKHKNKNRNCRRTNINKPFSISLFPY